MQKLAQEKEQADKITSSLIYKILFFLFFLIVPSQLSIRHFRIVNPRKQRHDDHHYKCQVDQIAPLIIFLYCYLNSAVDLLGAYFKPLNAEERELLPR